MVSPAAEIGVSERISVLVVVGEGVSVAVAMEVGVSVGGIGVGVAGRGVGLGVSVGVAVMKRAGFRARIGSGLGSSEIRLKPQASPAASGRRVRITINFVFIQL